MTVGAPSIVPPPDLIKLMTERAWLAVSALLPKSKLVISLSIRLGAQLSIVAKLPALTLATTVLALAGAIVKPEDKIALISSSANSLA